MQKSKSFSICLSLCGLALLLLVGCGPKSVTQPAPRTVIAQLDVAPVWSVHRVGEPQLITRDGFQYVAYYDHDRFLTLAQRELPSEEWTYHRFPVQMDWQTGAHARLSIAIDRDGYIHVTVYRRRLAQEPTMPPRPIYYRSLEPHSMEEFERLYFVDEDERTDYPTFVTAHGTLYFTFRDGGSGQGDQHFYVYDPDARSWSRVLDSPLLDGRQQMSAYAVGGGFPVVGPDGRFHLLWMWRDSPDHATNHSLSYARTVGTDLTRWESAAGVPVTPPFTSENTELLVDAAPAGGGLSNPLQAIAWDSQQRVVISYHRFDENGYSQIYNARFDGDDWNRVPSTDWNFVWGPGYSGTGALNIFGNVRLSSISPRGNGELEQFVWNRETEEAIVVLDEATLRPLRQEQPQPEAWRKPLLVPESGFQIEPVADLRRTGGPMLVELIPDSDGSEVVGGAWYLRWEHGGANRDRPVPEPWPGPSMLRLYKVSN
jgi:hypothetical protein